MLGTGLRLIGGPRRSRLAVASTLLASVLVVDAGGVASVGGPSVDPGVDGRDLVVWGGASVEVGVGASVRSGDDPAVVLTEAASSRRGAGDLGLLPFASVEPGVDLVGDDLSLGPAAHAGGDAYFGTLSGSGTIAGSQFGGLSTPVSITDEPAFRSEPPGSTDVAVPTNGAQTLLPGDYGRVRVGAGATLRLDGAGDYTMRSVTVHSGGSVEVDADDDVEIMVQHELRTSSRASFGPAAGASIEPSDLVVFVEGRDSSRGSGAILGERNRFEGTLYANTDRATASVGPHSSITGAVFGERVVIGTRATIVPDSFFGVAESDLSVVKSDDTDPIVAGNALTYTVEVTNSGPDDAENVVATDTLPAGVTSVSTTGCAEDPNGVPACSLGTIAAGDSASYTIEVAVDVLTSGSITNGVEVTSGSEDPNPGNNSTTEDTTVQPPTSDLAVTKSDDVDPAVPGDTVTYTVEVSNAGPDDAPNVLATDTLPAGVTLVSTTGCAEDPNAVPTCSLGTIPAGGSKSYTIEVTVDGGTLGTLTNAVSVSSAAADPNTHDNSTTEDTTVVQPEADLSVTKTDDADPVIPGDTVTYTIEVSNAGPQPAPNVVATDTLPAGVTFVSTTGCAEDPNAVPTCSLGTIPAGGSKSYTIEVTVDGGTLGTLTNSVSASSSIDDPDTGNDSTTEDTTVVPDEADLSVTKSDDADPILSGDTVRYTIEVSNDGPVAAPDVVATDTLPAGVTFVSTTGCAEDPNGVPACSLGTIPAGGSTSYTVEVTIDGGTLGTLTNSVSVASSKIDPDTSDNSTTEDTTVVEPAAPVAADDGPSGSSSPGDDHHTALNTTLTVVDGSSEDLLGNDDLGAPNAGMTSFGGGALGGAVTDNAPGATVAVGSGSLTLNANGTYAFTPDTNFVGLFTFDYRLTNAVGSSDGTVTIAVGERISSQDDSRDSIGNVGLDTSSGPAFSVLDNDSGDGVIVTSMATSSTQGGAVTDLGGGRFTYDPPAGFTGTDTFPYTTANGFGTGGGTVTINVSDMVWFVDNSAVTNGDGRLNSPFNTLAAFNSGASDAAADVIFLYETGSGDYTGSTTLLDDQRLIGQGSSDSLATAAGIVVPANSRALPSTGGNHPKIAETGASSAIVLASGNTVRGLDVANSGGGTGVLGTSVGSLTISEIESLTSTGGRALDLNAGTWSVDVDVVTVTASAVGGISLTTGTGSTASLGTVDLTTTGGTALAVNTAGTVDVTNGASAINSTSGRAVDVASTGGSLTFASITAASPTTTGIALNGTTGSFTVTGTTSITNRGGTGITFNNVAGTVAFGATTVSNGSSATGDGIRVDGSSAAFTFASVAISNTIVGSAGTFDGLGRPTSDGDGNGIFLKNLRGSFAVNGGSITDFADNAVDIRTSRNVTLSGITIDGNFAGNSAVQGHNVFNFTMTNTVIKELDNVNAATGVSDNGLRFTEVEGTFSITGGSVADVEGFVYSNASTGSDNRAIEVQNRQGCSVQDGTNDCNLAVTIDDLTIKNFDFQGVSIRHVGGTTDIDVVNSEFEKINGASVSTGPNQAGTHTHTVDVTATSFTDVGIAAELFSSRGGTTTATFDGNTVTRTHGDAIRLVAFNQAGSGSAATFLGTVSGNTMTGVAANVVGSAAGGAGIFVAAEDGVTAKVLVDGNSITGHTNTVTGLVAECIRTQNQRDGGLDMVVRNTSCTDFPTNFFGAVYIGNDFDTAGPPFTNTCVDFAATNSYSNTNGLFANTFATDSTGSSVLDLPNGFNSALPALDFGDAPTTGACSIAPLS